MQRMTVNVASAVARLQLQQQHINCNAKLSKSNNQLVMIALTTGCAPPESSDVRQRQVVDAETEGWAAESSGRRWKQAVGGKGEWWRQVVDAVAKWWAAEANGGGGGGVMW